MLQSSDWFKVCDIIFFPTNEKSSDKNKHHHQHRNLSCQITKTVLSVADYFVFVWDPVARGEKVKKRICFQGL